MRRSVAGLVVAAAFEALAVEPAPLPASVVRELPASAPVGSHRFRFVAFHVYDATLWGPAGRVALDAPFALDLRYAMSLRGRDLARRSVEEMRKQGFRDEAALARWQAEMDRVFPDIREGDRLVGVHVPGFGARFHDAQGLVGAVADPEFARAFFAIWLSERTSQPAMRRQLLGLEKP